MNEQLQQAVATMIEKSIRAFEQGADFMAAEIPDVVHQLLLWHATKSVIVSVSALIIAGLLVWVSARMFKKARAWETDDTVGYREYGAGYFAWTMANILVFILYMIVTPFNLTWLQIWIAPKVWLIEYAARMMK